VIATKFLNKQLTLEILPKTKADLKPTLKATMK